MLGVKLGQWFSGDLGHAHHYEDDDTAVLDIPVIDELCVPGTRALRASVLATLADIAAGSLVHPVLEPHVPLTVDLDVRRAGLEGSDRLVATALATKRGRTIQVLDVTFEDPDRPGRVMAVSTVRFIRSPTPAHSFSPEAGAFKGNRGKMALPFAEQLGAEIVGPGEAVIERRPYVMQPTGTIQGGAVTLVAELAAESAMGMPVADIDVSFLSAVHHGPAHAVGQRLWDGAARVQVRDRGHGDRLVATAWARGAPIAPA